MILTSFKHKDVDGWPVFQEKQDQFNEVEVNEVVDLRASAITTVDLSGSYLILLPLGIEETEKKK